MQPLRLAIVTRRFWPYCGPVETEAAEIAAAITTAGHQVEIISIRWEKNWPRSFQFRELMVTRINRPLGGPWGMFRYLRRLNRHVKDSQIDGLIVFGLTDESWAAIRNFARKMPVVVRIDWEHLKTTKRRPMNNRQVAVLTNVRRILVDSACTADDLIQRYSVPAELISIVPPGVCITADEQRTLSRQSTARSGLSDAHPILQIEANQPLVVCANSHFSDPGMLDLIDAWPKVLDQFPQARLWILGDGLKARAIWERICELGLANSIVMPGFFDDLNEVFQAADAYVHPLQADICCGSLVRALIAGVCTLATAQSVTSGLIEKNVNGLLIPIDNPAALAEAMCAALKNRELRERLGNAARERARGEFSIDDWVGRYLESFLSTTAKGVDSPAGS